MNAKHVFDAIDLAMHYHVAEILVVLAAALILIDYCFPTDWPAHVGYFCFSAAMFFVAYMNGFAPLGCLLVTLVVWAVLAMLHQFVFHKYLENAIVDSAEQTPANGASPSATAGTADPSASP